MRVWIYQSSRRFNVEEQNIIQQRLSAFVEVWNAHGKSLAAKAELRHGLFIILGVDEKQVPPSGCSIDSSVHFLKGLESEFGVSLFDRFQLAYRDQGEIKVAARQEFEQLVQAGFITSDTIVFNNMVTEEAALLDEWEIPFKKSWHAKVFN